MPIHKHLINKYTKHLKQVLAFKLGNSLPYEYQNNDSVYTGATKTKRKKKSLYKLGWVKKRIKPCTSPCSITSTNA